jgi:hypothetical protein
VFLHPRRGSESRALPNAEPCFYKGNSMMLKLCVLLCVACFGMLLAGCASGRSAAKTNQHPVKLKRMVRGDGRMGRGGDKEKGRKEDKGGLSILSTLSTSSIPSILTA